MLKNNSGQSMVEYGLIISFIVLLVVGAIVMMNGGLKSLYSTTGNSLKNSSGTK